MQVTAGVLLSAGSAVICFAVAVLAHRREAPGAFALAVFSAAAGVWAGGNAVQVAATTLDVKLAAVTVQYVGILALPLAWFAFAAAYTGRESWVTRRTVGGLAVVPVVVFALVVTNDVHHLVRVSAAIEQNEGAVRLAREFGPVFWIATAYANVVNAVGTVLLLEAAGRVEGRYRRQTAAVLVGVSVPWLANVAYLAGTTVVEPESFFGVTAVAFWYAIARYELFDLVPVARDRVLAELDDGVVVVDGRGRVADYNPAAERLLTASLSTGDAVADVFPVAVEAARADGESAPVKVVDGGEPRWLAVRTNPVSEDAPGEIVVLRDVTELERRRRELRRENERLEVVADTISHDLKSPLNVAYGYLELADENPRATEHVERALDRMDDIIEGTLRMARADLNAPELSDVALAHAAERAWLNVSTDAATIDVDTGSATVRADADQLGSLLENVFRNAVEHGSTSPTSQTRQDAVEHGSASPSSQTRQDSVEHNEDGVAVRVGVTDDGFFVADDGRGIPADERESAFERGYTTSDAGTGLGLSIVAEIAAAHDWTVDLAESAGGGVRVEVRGAAVTADATRMRG